MPTFSGDVVLIVPLAEAPGDGWCDRWCRKWDIIIFSSQLRHRRLGPCRQKHFRSNFLNESMVNLTGCLANIIVLSLMITSTGLDKGLETNR